MIKKKKKKAISVTGSNSKNFVEHVTEGLR